MSFDNYLRNQRTSTAVAFDEFIRRYTKPDFLHVFFEGVDDPSFYSGFIERYFDSKFTHPPYICGGKPEVYNTYSRVIRRLRTDYVIAKSIKVLFFVDKDHSDIDETKYPKDNRIFVTEYYSIENYLVTGYMFRKVWEHYFHFRATTIPDCEGVLQFFEVALKDFYEVIRPIMAWIIVIRKNGGRPQLDQLILDNLIQITDDLEVKLRIGHKYVSLYEALDRMCNTTTPPATVPAIVKMTQTLEKIAEPKKYVRGKCELWFFSKFVKRVAERLKKQKDLKFNFRNEQQLTEGGIVQSLAPRADMPEALKIFLETHQ